MPSNRTQRMLMTIVATLVAAFVLGGIGGVIAWWSGWYNIGATSQHLQPVYMVLNRGLHYSVRNHAEDVVVPTIGTPAQVLRGAAVYRDNCLQCHGGPGVAPDPIGMAMQPIPGPLIDASTRWKPRELYWITKHGIKMSGMPAWEYHMSEADMWNVVSFLTVLPTLPPPVFREMMTKEVPR